MMLLSVAPRSRVPRPEDCLAGGGAMGASMRAVDWDRTPLGPVASWPQSLRTALSMMLDAPLAMAIAWGPEFRWFYNDRYQPILGARHPHALGTPGAEIFPETWDAIGPELARVVCGQPVVCEGCYLPLGRGGHRAVGRFTLSHSPIRDETGGIGGVLVIATEAARQVESERPPSAIDAAHDLEAPRAAAATRDALAAQRRLHELFEHIPASIAVVRADDLTFEMANRHYLATAGLRHDPIGRRAFDVFPHLRGRGLEQMIAVVRRTGEPCVVKEMAAGDRSWSFVLAPIKDEHGAIDRILSFSYEITELVLVRQHAEAAITGLQDTVSLLDATLAGLPVGLSVHDRALRAVQINDALARWTGLDRDAAIGRPLADVVPRDAVDRISRDLRKVFATGAATEPLALAVRSLSDRCELRRWLVTCYPVHAPSGEVIHAGVVVVDLTSEPRARADTERDPA